MSDDKVIPFAPISGNPNAPIPVNPPENWFEHLDDLLSMDVEAFFNMRDWLTKAVEANGATKVGGGIGCGQADIDIELDGSRYNISIRPLSVPSPQETASE